MTFVFLYGIIILRKEKKNKKELKERILMAKINFNKLGLDAPGGVKPVEVNDQTIDVLQYLPTFDKLRLVNSSITESILNGIVNPQILDYTFDRAVLAYYTNINFTEKQLESDKVYDTLIASGVFDKIWDAIPDQEKQILVDALSAQVDKVDKLLVSMASGLSANTKSFQDTVDFIMSNGPGADALKDKGLGDLAANQ